MPDVKFSNQYPYTDFHELNLDWVINEVKYWSTKVGKTIQSIDLTGTVGLVDTYTITYSDGTTSTFDVTNGNGIASVAKTGTAGLVDTYTITFQDGSTSTFTVTNGAAAVDPTLTLPDYAADAKVTGDRISARETADYAALQSEGFGAYNTKLDISVLEWEFGNLSTSGVESNSTTRIRSKATAFDAITKISIDNTYVFTVLGYDKAGNVVYNSNNIGWVNEIELPSTMICRFLVRYASESTLPASIFATLPTVMTIETQNQYIDERFQNVKLGNLDAGTGQEISSTNRCIGDPIPVLKDDIVWTCLDGDYKFYAYYFNTDGSFHSNAGVWKRQAFVRVPVDGFVRIVMAKNNDNTIDSTTLADIPNYFFVRKTSEEIVRQVEATMLPTSNAIQDLYSKFERKGYDVNTIWADSNIRLTMTDIQEAKTNILLYPLKGIRMAIMSWKTLTPTLASDYIFDSGWVTNPYVIAKGEYFSISLSHADNSVILPEEKSKVIGYYFNGYFDGGIDSYAHRGFSAIAPENTQTAFIMARNKGFKIVESDVQITSDGKFVMIHDDTIDRTSNGSGYVSAHTLAELKALDFGSWKSAKYAGEQIPTLDEFLSLCRNIGLSPIIEIKGTSWTSSYITALVTAVKKYGLIESTIFAGTDASLLADVRAEYPNARVLYATNVAPTDATVYGLNNNDGRTYYGVLYTVIDSSVAALCYNNNIKLAAWTIDSRSAIISADPTVCGIYSNCWHAAQILYGNIIF